ncbi:ATP-dependent helicase [Amycolatopsis balhimycina DSM 5908]|uniref:ATP-dependent helicase n=1 Tax=Amycolatopsis balhimycina DSM 5908 TaxID=1081091 RepID=A0A428VVN0_AMYBA|nr:UvrD-helicase domain-containing protein [Amycolatopsis balhimycina]RSM34822.1 ATP-dependent helicase [Amycolatopsis balhimycina DSM 5908]
MTYEPNDEQEDVINSVDPVLVVAGGAGTGKTTTAIAAARTYLEAADKQLRSTRAAAERACVRAPLLAHQRVLFLSFSRTAVAQIIDRAGDVIRPYGPRLEVATFHGFAWRIITSFGAHYGFPPPLTVLSSASVRVPGAPNGLTYPQLLPGARKLLSIPQVSDHYAGRYGLVICDEFQDTDGDEWQFFQLIAPRARRILLGDVNQSIYGGFKPGVDPLKRIASALAIPGARKIDLPPASHRDPTGVLPAAAEAARLRRFADPALRVAADSGRLTITQMTDDRGHGKVVDLARRARRQGHSVNIFTHTNVATTQLSDALTVAGLKHEQVGFGEAYGEALAAHSALVRYAIDDGMFPLRELAVYITATQGGKGIPPLAQQVLDPRGNPVLERAIAQLATDLRDAATPLDLGRLADTVTGAYARVGTFRGQETWTQAAQRTRNALLGRRGEVSPTAIVEDLGRLRDESLVGNLAGRRRPIQVMNLHQTKGREADTTILLLGTDEFYGRETEPYPDGSRLLYVVMTRARRQSHLVVPAVAHPLWRPLINVCRTNI